MAYQGDHYRYLAPFYESLARFVFGEALIDAHKDLIIPRAELAEMTEIYWLGGGTGHSLCELIRASPHAKLFYIH